MKNNNPDKSTNPTQKSVFTITRSAWSLSSLIDQIFFIFAGIMSLWLAWLVWREGLHSGIWWLVLLFVIAWIIIAYATLPRLHRCLTNLYVPNYFIGRTKTTDGLLANPINIATRGSEIQIHRAMQNAGWALADETTPRSALRMAKAVLSRTSYKNAPVSPEFLFHNRQNFTYQQEVSGNPSQRHHIRFWKCPKGWLLPGGLQVDWLAAANYDRSVSLSLFTLQITHSVAEDIDVERDYVVGTVQEHNKTAQLTTFKDFATGYHSRNGGGDLIKTDGNLLVLELGDINNSLKGVEQPLTISEIIASDDNSKKEKLLNVMWNKRPPQMLLGSIVLIGIVVLWAVQFMTALPSWLATGSNMSHGLMLGWELMLTLGLSFVLMSIEVVLIVLIVLRGIYQMRIGLMSVAGFSAILDGISVVTMGSGFSSIMLLVAMGLHISLVLMFSSDAARMFTKKRLPKKQ